MNISHQLVRPAAALLLVAVLAGVFFLLPGQAESAGLGEQGHWEYVPTTYSNANDTCPEGLRCREWCFVGPDGLRPTGQLCCVDANNNCISR